MNADSLAAIAGVALSLSFSYVPGLRARYEVLDPVHKRLVMLGLLVLAAAGVFSLACSGWAVEAGLAVECDRAGLAGLLRALVLATIANQSTFLISPSRPLESGRVARS